MMKNTLFFIFLLPQIFHGQSLSEETHTLFEQKNYVKAENMLKKHLQSHPKDIEAIEFLGDAYGHQRDWDNAIKYYGKLVEANPDHANYHYKYGGALGMKLLTISKIKALPLLDDLKEAFLKAAELDPKHVDARWALVELYIQLPGIVGGSMKRALGWAEELEQLSKVDGYLAKGYVYEYEDEPEKAEYYYKLAIMEGGSITCFQKLTDLYENTDQPKKAIANLEASYDKHNLNALHYQIGKVCADYNIELEKGERCLKNYIANYSARDGVPIEWAYFRLAQIHKNWMNKEEALNWIDKALDVRSDFSQALEEKQKILSL